MSNTQMFVTKRKGTQELIKFDKITDRIRNLLNDHEIDKVDPILVTQKVVKEIYSGITTAEVDFQSAEICVNMATVHPFYGNLAGRILVSNLHKITANHFVEKMTKIQNNLGFLDEKWLSWIKKNRKEINSMIDYERDYIFDYFGIKTLERAYLIKIKNEIIERPQDMFMRVASFLNQGDLENTKKTYDLISNGFYTHATPTLFNSGNKRSQLSSCFLLGTHDSLEGITHTWDSVSKISKWGGGIGLHVSNIRAKDSLIRGTNGPSSGIIPMLKVYNEIARYINQGGKRKGSIAIYLEPWHPDIMAFLDLRKNFGAETERARDLFLAVWLPDLFMKRVEENGDWYLMCPDESPGLADVWGENFEKLYNKYIDEGKFRGKLEARKIMQAILDSQLETGTPYVLFKDTSNRKSNQQNIGTIKSSNLCAEILLYSDDKEYAVCNLASIAVNTFVKPFEAKESFTIFTKPNCRSSKFTIELLKYKKYKFEEKNGILEKGISVQFPQIYYGDKLIGGFNELYNFIRASYDYDKLEEVAYMSARNLDRVIDVNYYPTVETKLSNVKHRPIGVGIQGLADALVLLKIPFDSEEAIIFNSKFMERIYYGCVKASNDIAKARHSKMKTLIDAKIEVPEFYSSIHHLQDKELDKLYHEVCPNEYEIKRTTSFPGSYSSFDGSPFSRGILQFDMWNVKPSMVEKWNELKKDIAQYGMRNSQLTALMPTATTSQILGNNECFEFFTNNIYNRRTLAGNFKLVNEYLVDDLLALGLWSNDMKDLIISYNGSIAEINVIPDIIKKLYPIIWEIKQSWVLKNAVARGPYIDQTQSMNIFMPVPDSQKLNSSHMWAWKNGLKTGIYYLRTKPAEEATKFTIDPNIQKMNLQLDESILNKKTERKLKKPEEGEICESCSS